MSSLRPIHALSLDSVQQQAFIKYFNSLPEKPPTTVRIFDRNDYYTVHGVDAATSAREVFSTVANIKTMGLEPNRLEYLVLSKKNFEVLIKNLLLVRRYRVEIYVAEVSVKSNDWTLKYKASPGYLSQLEEVLGDGLSATKGHTPCLMAVNIKTDPVSKCRLLGVACVTAGDYEMSVAEFTDDDLLSELGTISAQMAPSECLVPQLEGEEYKILKRIMDRANITVTKLKKVEFSTVGLNQDLNRLLKFKDSQQQDANAFPETIKEAAMASLAAAIKYTALLSDNSNFGRYRLTTIEADSFLHLDAAALNALNVLPEVGHKAHFASRSLFGVLNKCRTQQGKRLLAQWLRQPLRDINLINERLDIVELFVTRSRLRQQLYGDYLRRIPDLQALARRLARKKANLLDCYRIYQAVSRMPLLLECLSEAAHPTLHSSLAEPLHELTEDLEKYKQMIEATLDMEGVDNGIFLVRSSFDDGLHTMGEQLRAIQKNATNELHRAAEDLGLEPGKSIKLESNPQTGYFLRVTRKDEHGIRNNKTYAIVDAVKGGVRFVTEGLGDLNERFGETKTAYEQEQKRIVGEIVAIAAGYSETLYCLSHILSRLDVLVAFAVTAATAPFPYCRPVVTENGNEFVLKDVRHPCVEVQPGVSYIPNDMVFKRDSCIMKIVTGANMGGKSTWMRSCGIAALLAHAGAWVPASVAVVPRLRGVCARVGASDREDKGQSSFMLEMVEIAAILRTATPDTLVLVDELGRGTSTFDGCGIAWAIAEELATQSKCFSLFATHYHELTRLAGFHPGVIENCHAESALVNNQLVLLHKISPGPALQSMGLHIAKMANLPEYVINYAESLQSRLRTNLIDAETLAHPQDFTEGQAIILEFLRQCQRVRASAASDEVMMKQIAELKQQVLLVDNRYVQSLVGRPALNDVEMN